VADPEGAKRALPLLPKLSPGSATGVLTYSMCYRIFFDVHYAADCAYVNLKR